MWKYDTQQLVRFVEDHFHMYEAVADVETSLFSEAIRMSTETTVAKDRFGGNVRIKWWQNERVKFLGSDMHAGGQYGGGCRHTLKGDVLMYIDNDPRLRIWAGYKNFLNFDSMPTANAA
jgi:hypothetical protein